MIRRPRDERGAILVLSVAGVVVAMIAAALAVDLGTLAHEARRDQKVADLAALDAVRVLPTNPTDAARKSALRNGFDHTASGHSLLVEWAPDVTSPFSTDPVTLPTASVVRVTASSPHKNAFLAGSRTVSRKGLSGRGNPIGTVRIGSKLASVSPMQDVLLDKSISALVGGSVNLSAVGWEGLASGNVGFSALTGQLAAVTGNSTFNVGTVDQVLHATFTANQLFTAMAGVLRNDGNAADVVLANNVQNIGAQINGTYLSQSLSLFDLFDFGSVVIGNKQDIANANLNVLDLIRGATILGDGDHFASFNLVASDIIGPAIPGGFNSAKISLGLIEAPRTSFPGSPGKDSSGVYYTHAETSQIRVRIDLDLTVPLLLTGTIDVPLVGSLTSVHAKPSYVLEAGRGHAYLDALRCTNGAVPDQVDILGVTETSTSKLGFTADANLKSTAIVGPLPVSTIGGLVSELGGAVTGSTTGVVTTSVPGNSGVMLHFTPPYAATSPSQPVPGAPLALPAPDGKVTASILGVVSLPLISDIVNGIKASGLTFSTGGGSGVDTNIVKPLYDALGLGFGGADVWAPPPQLCRARSALITPTSGSRPPVLIG